MKSALLLCVLANSALAAVPVLPRITPEALVELQKNNPMTRLQSPPKGKSVARRPEDQSIIRQSVILNDGKNWTLVPKGAVIFLPDSMKHRVVAKPVGTLLPWSEFLSNNIAWIATHDVSFDQATGAKPLPAERAAFWAKHDKLVIAVHQNGPISVLASNNPQSSPRS